MKTKQDILDSILTQGMLPLFYHKSEEVSIEVTRTLYKAGIRVIEYTNRGEAALENFKALVRLQKEELPELILGIGTIKTAQQATDYVDAGAHFLISPIVAPEVAAVAVKNDLMWVPGCMTPTEIHQAQQFGALLIKLFPANILGPAFVSSIRELFPGQLFMPTGGVELEHENISGWFHAGVCAVGMGSKLITKNVLEYKEYDQLYTETLRALQIVQSAR
jgi:2-dehydro-3-deoxyphosphogluconate aldolase / (4S)-4-hydroxy-2-oxoglutarate aldolase